MMIIFSGGTGTPKLIDGINRIVKNEKLKIVVNTADDIEMSNLYISPDIDTIIYLLNGTLDDKKWWGIKNDTFYTYNELDKFKYQEILKIGDKDRALSIVRSNLLKSGYTLTESINKISKNMGIKHSIYPMTNVKVNTII